MSSLGLAGQTARLDAGLLRALFESLSAGVYATDRAGTVITVNPAAEELVGAPAGWMLGRNAHATVHYKTLDGRPRPADECPLLGVMRSGERARSDEDTFWRLDGTALPVWWLSAPVLVDGQVMGAVVIFDDASVRQQYETGISTVAALDQSGPTGGTTPEDDPAAAAHERLVMLARLGEVLSTLDLDEGMRRLARLVVGPVADWSVVDRLEDGLVRRITVEQGPNPMPLPSGQRTRPLAPVTDASTGSLARALASSEPVLVVSTADQPGPASDDPLDVEQARLVDQLGAASLLVVSLTARHHVIGAMTWARRDPDEPFTDDDVEFAEAVGRRAGLALDNARLYGLQRQAAEQMQRSLLSVPPQPNHLSLVARYLPAAEGADIGGDWYDAFLVPGGATVLVIGDVVGHDMVAAAAMAQLRNLLRAVAIDREEPPSGVLARLDRLIAQLPEPSLATCLVARIEQDADDVANDTRTVRWSSAGHLPPTLVLPDHSVRQLEGESDLLLGVAPELPRTDHVHTLAAGSTIVLHTDGLIERSTASLDHGLARLRRALTAGAHLPLDECIDEAVARLVEPGHPDDVAVIAMRLNSERRPVPPAPERLI